MLALALEVGLPRDVALLRHPFDDLLDQLLELGLAVGVRRVAEQALDGLVREQVAAEDRLENRVVQRLQGVLTVVVARIADTSRPRSGLGGLGYQGSPAGPLRWRLRMATG